ncbi:3-deoxy-8-phosphooctulonate synthase [Iocasia frigidifontis]|uniref:2-dehydro-3-deoxyphosphooctonate aldolase n=1 Tax=Iocasia fonsfrigidae TaxID=2682810 RepID=A0A8A7K549_9FIRM|nr:3-deoxy-8-phosphooctulonate synthase [Iocasia fonsfrigidae]QTL96816.1 3-deoxy-8-phosphooctulonate synthase [Iocasia fonsfrigidae]
MSFSINKVKLNEDIIFGDLQKPLILIAGPCVLEGYERSLKIASRVKEIADALSIPYVFKASFDKANRSSINSYRGPGLEKGLKQLKKIKEELQVPVLTDIHQVEQVEPAAEVVDILQIPAFLCRQTDLLLAAARTDLIVNIKKGQFMAPWDMAKAVDKVVSTGSKRILLTERGVSFGYNNLLADMTSLPKMREIGYPVVFDATHSVQRPAAQGEVSGGDREMVPYLARAAAAVGIDGLFMEVHDNPAEALSDGPNMVYLDDLEDILQQVQAINRIVKDR